VTDRTLGRILAVFILACIIILVFAATLGVGIRLINWAFSA
jgi:hypothetical protein